MKPMQLAALDRRYYHMLSVVVDCWLTVAEFILHGISSIDGGNFLLRTSWLLIELKNIIFFTPTRHRPSAVTLDCSYLHT